MELLQWTAAAAILYLVAIAAGAAMRFKNTIRRGTERLWKERVKGEPPDLLHEV